MQHDAVRDQLVLVVERPFRFHRYNNPGTSAVMLRCFLRKAPSGSNTCVSVVNTTVILSPPCESTDMVAPLRPLITPFT